MIRRDRAWRRYKSYIKAKRKRDIDAAKGMGYEWWRPWYNNLHQYSKNKIHCSCHMCSAKTRNKGRRRHLYGNYAPNINYTHTDIKKLMRMAADEKDYYEEDS